LSCTIASQNPPKMLTHFISEVSTRFNPFSTGAKTARLFLTRLPPGARASGMNITTQLLPRNSTEPSSLMIKFSAYSCPGPLIWLVEGLAETANGNTEDGMEMKLDCETMNIKSVVEVVDRHSRQLQKQADLE
jgi:large subunit ribosomal protein L53